MSLEGYTIIALFALVFLLLAFPRLLPSRLRKDIEASGGGQDNRERLLQDEIRELREEVKHIRSQQHLLFFILVCLFLASLLLWSRLV
jgi:MFS-type transporter involved in bile tolerance (Atg22 family)